MHVYLAYFNIYYWYKAKTPFKSAIFPSPIALNCHSEPFLLSSAKITDVAVDPFSFKLNLQISLLLFSKSTNLTYEF